MQSAAETDGFRGFTLSLNGQPVSHPYLPIENGVVVYGDLGYDPEFAKSVCRHRSSLSRRWRRFSLKTPHRYFDFTHGIGQTKRMFVVGPACFRGDVYFFRWTALNLVTVLGHVAMERLSESLGKILRALGLREMVRKLMRRL